MNTESISQVAQEPAERHSHADVEHTSANVGDVERIVSVVAGAASLLIGMKRGTLGGVAVAVAGGALVYRGLKGRCGVYDRLGISTAQPATAEQYNDHGIRAEFAITVDKPAAELYSFWRELETLPRFMRHLKSVKRLDEKRSNWVARGPAGTSVHWDAEIINDVPNETIAWRSLAGAQVDNAGSVRFVPAPGGRGTEVQVVIQYVPPGRTVGKWVAKLFGEDPQTQIETDMRRFKQLMEAGETSTIDGQSRGSCSTRSM